MEKQEFYTIRYYKIAKIGTLIVSIPYAIIIILNLTIESNFFSIGTIVMSIINFLWFAFISLIKEPYVIVKDNEFFAPFYLWYKGYEFDYADMMTIESIPLEAIDRIEFSDVKVKKRNKEKKMVKIHMKDELIICVEVDIFKDDDISKIREILMRSYINAV